MAKEKNGFVWIGTNNGLNRYDGFGFKIYNKGNSNIGSNDISDILIDSKSRIWITTLGGGLHYYHPLNDTFQIFRYDSKNPKSLLSNNVTTLIEDSKGLLWLGTEKGLCSFNPSTKKFTSYSNQFNNYQTKKSNSITSIYEDKNNKLWIGTFGNGLFLFDRISGKFNQIKSENTQISDFINVISPLNQDKILIGTSGTGLLLYDSATGKFSDFLKQNLGLKQEINIVRSIKIDNKNNLWIGTDGNGLLEVQYPNSKRPVIHNYLYNSQLETSLSGNSIYDIMADDDSNIWIGTAWNGICVLDKKNKTELIYSDIVGLNPSPVLSIYKKGLELFLGLDGEGMTVFNTHTNKIKYYNEKKHNSTIKGNYIQKIIATQDGAMWLGTFKNGLVKFNQQTNQFTQYKHNFNNKSSISFDDVRDIIEDKNHNLWIATWGGGLNYFDTKTQNFTSYRESVNNNKTVNNDNLIDMVVDGDKIWIATFGGGLNLFDTTKKVFRYYKYKDSDSNTISNNNIFSLCKDSKGYLWIGTAGGGINRMNLKTQKIERFEKIDHIKYQTITGIIEDNNHTIWFSTKQGIINYNYRTNTFNNLPKVTSEFHINSIFKDERGWIYFGGIDGVIKINPKTIGENTNQPKVKLTNFKLFNKEVPVEKNGILTKDIAFTDEITLDHNQDVMTLEFSALQFPFSNSCEYAIKMENFDEEWRFIGKDRTATFTNLSPGNYIFKVKSRETGGQWGNDYAAVKIHISRPFWLQWWAFVLYGGVLFLLFYLFRKYTIEWERLKTNLEFQKLTHEKDKELYNLKQQFFTNISHEIRTPVTLILSSINRLFDNGEMVDSKQIKSAHTIRKNSNLLLQLVNELLDIRKFEANDIQLKITENDFVSYCKEIYLSFTEIASDRNIEYTFESENSKIDLWFDKNQLEKVLNNLLTNAFKFTNNGGSITVTIETDDEAVYLIVKDTGVGMSQAHLGEIFNRFYQINNTETKDKSGFGLGLSITKEIIDLHKGSIEVKSEKNKGSVFEVRLLKSDAHFYENEIEKPEVVTNHGLDTINHLKQKTTKNELKKETILIVEDNPAIQESLKEILSNDYSILQAYNGEEGLKIASEDFPDLIISDIMMPVMDGIEFVKNLKLNTFTSHIPIIILTARTTVENKMEGLETGADDYITKPFDEELLKARISNLLNNRKLIREKFINDNLLNPRELAISSPDQLFLERLYEILEPNLESNNLKAEIVAKEVGMSHSVMYKKIKALTGLSYVEFIRDYRLSIAKQLIQDLGYSVSDACYKVGYSDRKYFSKLFKEKFKKNPSEFLKSNHTILIN